MKKILNHLATDWYKYLLELIVITAGVLGAFSLNSWNQSRKDTHLKTAYLERLISDLQHDTASIAELNREILNAQGVIRSTVDMIGAVSDEDAKVLAMEIYFSKGWLVYNFTPHNITNSDLAQTGNMNLLGPIIAERIQEYYALIDEQHKYHVVNKNWITPIDLSLSEKTTAFEFDPRTKELFLKSNRSLALEKLMENGELIKRNAAGHYWMNSSLIDGLESINELAIDLMKVLRNENSLN